jgi:DNA (cytosine-5)-methyltransferase 3A
MRILKDIQKTNPDVKFLLENVIMGDKWQKILTRAIGINPIRINASLVSAQNRDRLFWTNIAAEPDGLFGDMKCTIPQPKDRGILLRDVLEHEVDEKYYLKNPKFGFEGMSTGSKCITFRTGGKCSQSNKHNYDLIKIDIKGNIKANQDKASCFTAGGNSGGNHSDMDLIVCVASRGRNPENPTSREPGLPTEQQLEARGDGKTNCLTSVQKDNLIIHNMMPRSSKSGKGGTGHLTRNDGKTYCLDTGNTNAVEKNQTIRRLTPIECERLQCVDDNYTNHVSDTQRYRMLGNGWNCEVIAHIFSHLQL